MGHLLLQKCNGLVLELESFGPSLLPMKKSTYNWTQLEFFLKCWSLLQRTALGLLCDIIKFENWFFAICERSKNKRRSDRCRHLETILSKTNWTGFLEFLDSAFERKTSLFEAGQSVKSSSTMFASSWPTTLLMNVLTLLQERVFSQF